MRARTTLSVLGCTLVLIGPVVVPVVAGTDSASAATAAPANERHVRALAAATNIPKSVQREIDSVDSVEDLARISPQARKIIQAPTVEVVEAGKATEAAGAYAAGTGKVGRACWRVWVSRKRQNQLGWVLMSAKTTVAQWCHNGTTIRSTPTVQRAMRGRWGYSFCAMRDAFAGFVNGRSRYHASADAAFVLGSGCRGTTKTIHSEMNVYGSGKYGWRT
jgi:hypothetical protein